MARKDQIYFSFSPDFFNNKTQVSFSPEMERTSEITVVIPSSSGISWAWDVNSAKQKKPSNNKRRRDDESMDSLCSNGWFALHWVEWVGARGLREVFKEEKLWMFNHTKVRSWLRITFPFFLKDEFPGNLWHGKSDT